MKKQTINTFYCTIEVAVFRTAVLVIVARSRKDIVEDLPRIYSSLNVNQEADSEDLKKITDVWNGDEDPEYMPPGETIRLANASGDVLIFFNADSVADVSEELIVHETHHAATYLCKFRGIDDEECEAYVQEYLFNQILCKIDEYNDNHKKKKQ
jgi:hypothetical protein